MNWELVALVLVCYALGCLNAGYYVVRWRTGADVRTLGTGTAGARNAGRQLGKSGFVVTFLLDFAKGAAAVSFARLLDVGDAWTIAAMLAVVAGHIWPAQLGLRGGKGLATATGGLLVFAPYVLGIAAILVAVVAGVTRRVTASGLIGVAAVPVVGLAIGGSGTMVAGLLALAVLVLFAHRFNIKQQFSSKRTRQMASDALSSATEERLGNERRGTDLQDSV